MIYSLPILNEQNPADVEGILASLTLGMLPSPSISEEPTLPIELRDRIIHEMRVALRLKRDDNSPTAKAKIYDYLAKEISRAALGNVDIKEIKSRLGQRGDLAPSLYKVEFSPEFKNEHERKGATRADVELTLRAPDAFEHVHPAGMGIDDDKATSLYVRQFSNSVKPLNTFTLLVSCQRIGYVQRVGQAWLVFHSDVDLSTAKTPSDVLRAFVGKYGLELQVGEKVDKFFWYERVALHSDKKTDILKFKPTPGVDVSIVFQQGLISMGSAEIVYAFAIHSNAYEADLRKHGIRIAPLRQQPAQPVR